MSETPNNPEHASSLYLSEEKLVELQGIVDLFVHNDAGRTNLGASLLSTRRKINDNLDEEISVQWYKNPEDQNLSEQVHAVINITVGPVGKGGNIEKFMIAMVPELCFVEFRLGDESQHMAIDTRTADELIARLQSFLPYTDK